MRRRRPESAEIIRGLLSFAVFLRRNPQMIETNPIRARIADLTDRVASLRGFL